MASTHKTKVLILIDWYLPGFRAGGPIRSCANLIARLSDEFEFTVITTDTDYMEDTPYPGIKKDQWNILEHGTKVWYIPKAELSAAVVRKLIDSVSFDRVYLNGIFSKYFTLVPLRHLQKKDREKMILATRGMLAPSALKIKSIKKKAFLGLAKATGLFDGILFHVTNPDEKEDVIRNFGTRSRIIFAPNLAAKETMGVQLTRKKIMGSIDLVNVARISPEKNLLYALQVLHKVRSNVNFDIYGPVYDQAYWNECLSLINDMPGNIKVNYKGVIEPGKMHSMLSTYHFLFMPTRGENFGHIIIQSFAAGTPVLISDQTPWKELGIKKLGFDLPLDDQNNFILALEVSALLSQEEFDELAISSHLYALSMINNDSMVEQNRLLFR